MSNLTLALCDANGNALETRRGPGAAESRGRFAQVFDQLAASWVAHGPRPVVLCGTVGSSFGWCEAPLLPCPADLHQLTGVSVAVREGIRIVPGLRCTNRLGAPDVMRGEETQLLGARVLDTTMSRDKQLVCMPGTHTKWVSLNGSVVQEFLTAPTGELFAMLCEHSVLVREQAAPIVHDPGEFDRGLAAAANHPDVSVLHKLFQCRSLRLDQQLSRESAPSWMSGLLIGTDVASALPLFAGHDGRVPVHVIGAPQLTALYALAITRRGRTVIQIDGAGAALAGLALVYREQERRD
ncbi:MAG TPA: 2-dehydro-3-deoxygalactonokinase [Steroidobacteraceae bacterium]|nr:2-dehydro-3-deoxygalactonokinase [Steroidobacteraceae bacterium]